MIEEIEEYAKQNHIPIMMKDGIDYLCDLIFKHHMKRILEIGTAIGYSAIRMALVDPEISIVSIERDPIRYQIALKNIQKMNLERQIRVVLGDALETEIMGEFDFIFIDASKGHSIDFFKRYSKNLASNGMIVTDNLSFHGLVEDERLAVTKNQRGIVRKIKAFISFLDHCDDFETIYVEVGDKISISKRCKMEVGDEKSICNSK